MDWDSLLFNASAFIAGLCLLEYGADAFIDNTAVIARRLGVSQTLIALLTAGAEWEELAVVIAAVVQHKHSLALGNTVGSSISNILGAFSLGLLFHPGPVTFDRSAKIYTGTLFLVTTFFAVLIFLNQLGRAAGIVFIVVFIVYVLSIMYAIYNGVLDVPEANDSDDSDDSEAEDERDEEVAAAAAAAAAPTETSALLSNGIVSGAQKPKHSLPWHIFQLVLGFIALSLSGYVLSHTASSLASAMHLSNTVVGITILSFATTLPEKFLSVMSGARGHGGIVVAATAGSNIFLLTLCLGIIFVVGDGNKKLEHGMVAFEIWSAWISAAVLLAIVFTGGRRWMGAVLLAAYIAFIVLEFTVYRR